MANRTHYKGSYWKTPATHHVYGRFKTTNGTVPTELAGDGAGSAWTIAYTAEGKWTVTLACTYPELLCITGSAMLASAAANAGDLVVHFDPIEEDTAVSSFVVYLSQDGTDADTPGAWVNFHAIFRGSQGEK